MRKLIARLMTGALLASGLMAATAGIASAHTPEASANCQGIDVKLTNYEPGSWRNPYPNKVTVTIDGATVRSETFGAYFIVDNIGADKIMVGAQAHSWAVIIDADGAWYDRTLTGSVGPCFVPPIDIPARPGVTDPTCELGSKIVLPTNANVRFTYNTLPDGTVRLVAETLPGRMFTDGKSVTSWDYRLTPALDCRTPIKLKRPKVFVGTCIHTDRDGFIQLPSSQRGVTWKLSGPLSARKATATIDTTKVYTTPASFSTITYGPYDLRRESNANCKAANAKPPVAKPAKPRPIVPSLPWTL